MRKGDLVTSEIEFPTNPGAWVSESHPSALKNKELDVPSLSLWTEICTHHNRKKTFGFKAIRATKEMISRQQTEIFNNFLFSISKIYFFILFNRFSFSSPEVCFHSNSKYLSRLADSILR